jgi:hypothetical protein
MTGKSGTLNPTCRAELEIAMQRLSQGTGNTYGIHERYRDNIATVSVATIVAVLDLHARVMFPQGERPAVRRVKWRDVQFEGTRRGTLYALTRKGVPPMFFAISQTEVRRVIAKLKS